MALFELLAVAVAVNKRRQSRGSSGWSEMEMGNGRDSKADSKYIY